MTKCHRRGDATQAVRRTLALAGLLLWMLWGGLTGTRVMAQERKGERLKVGLVLGGGGAKGAAHIGALKIIEKSGIPIDYIAGTSIGSIVGGLYACGYRADDMIEVFKKQDWLGLLTDRDAKRQHTLLSEDDDGVVYILGFPVSRKGTSKANPSRGAFRGDRIQDLLDSMIVRKVPAACDQQFDFCQLPIPFKCVAFDTKNRQEYVFNEGRLSTAMRASMAIPMAYKAVTVDGMELADGGMVNNLPVDVVRAMGADVVIAIDLSQHKHGEEDDCFRVFDNDSYLGLFDGIDIDGLLGWVLTRPDLDKYHENCKHCDVYINPDLDGYTAAHFRGKDIKDMVIRGYKAAKKQRKALKKLKKRINSP